MRRVGHLFERVVDFHELRAAARRAARGGGWRSPGAARFLAVGGLVAVGSAWWMGSVGERTEVAVSEGVEAVSVGDVPASEVRSAVVGTLRYLPPGSFVMGSPAGEAGRDDDEAQHTVRLTRGFYLMEHEVTEAQFEVVMGFNPAAADGCSEGFGQQALVDPSYPVHCVSWEDAAGFAERLSAREGVRYRLPTEAEWEYAARGGRSGEAWAGASRESDLCRVANLVEGSAPCTDGVPGLAPVGSYAPNGWGFRDLTGNVLEWVEDWYGPYAGDSVDPRGPAGGSYRVHRGGCWRNGPAGARVAGRGGYEPSDRYRYLGFRLARDP